MLGLRRSVRNFLVTVNTVRRLFFGNVMRKEMLIKMSEVLEVFAAQLTLLLQVGEQVLCKLRISIRILAVIFCNGCKRTVSGKIKVI